MSGCESNDLPLPSTIFCFTIFCFILLLNKKPIQFNMLKRLICEMFENLKHDFIRYRSAAVVYVAALLLLTAEWTIFRIEVVADDPSTIATFVKGIPEIAVILIPFFFLKPKFRWLTFIPVLLLSLFFLVNVLYFRVFFQLIPWGSFFMFGNFDNTLFDSASVLCKPSDIIFAVSPLVYIGILVSNHYLCQPSPLIPKKTRFYAVGAILGLYFLTHAFIFICNWFGDEQIGKDSTILENISYKYFRVTTFDNNVQHDTGLVHYLVTSLIREIIREKKINNYTSEQLDEIHGFLQERNRQYVTSDSTFADNKDKNLIFIIVESLNSECIGKKIDGVEITPNLNRLLEMDGTISALNVVSQAADGHSADGQLIYNTGLLPLTHGVAAMECGRNEYISLGQLLDRAISVDVICESLGFWNHTRTSQQYGFDNIFSVEESNIDYSENGYDKEVFDLAIEVLKDTQQPFYAEITTLSTHQPFNQVGNYTNDTILSLPNIPQIKTKYFNSIKYFDLQLGYFLQELERCGLLSNSVIVIAADHNIDFQSFENKVDASGGSPFIPFIAVNTGVTLKIDKIIGQCDIFPTILEIMDASNDAEWRGVGLSIFNPQSGCAPSSTDETSLEQAKRVSDLLLRGYGTKPLPIDTRR